ncbi:MAG: undecaprenyl-diphosphate phosphatase [Gammaproteobacteria bacterium]
MDLIQIIVLAIVQGITEFLPVSSSAHLILVPMLTAWQDQGLAIDVAAHLGSLFAVVFYFRTDVCRLGQAGLHSCKARGIHSSDERLFWILAIATLPVLMIGLLAHDLVALYLRHPLIIATASIGFGLLLLYADKRGRTTLDTAQLHWKHAIFIGLAQALALVPGTSRSGITMTAGLLLGLDRKTSARLSFLLAIPVIFCAGGYELVKLLQGDIGLDIVNFLLTAVLSALSALLAIHYFLRFLDRIGMLPFVIYRVLLGVVLIVLFI